MDIREKIQRRLGQKSKKEQLLSARKGGDIDKVKMKSKKVKQFTSAPVGKNERVVNNAFLPARMLPSKADRMRFRQEVPQDIGARPFQPDAKKAKDILKPLDKTRFVRVANSAFRNEESVLDQSERMVFNRNIKRELSQELNKLKHGDDEKIADLVRDAHVAEKKAQAEKDGQFLSKFTGPVKTLVEVPEIKQEVDANLQIQKRAVPSQKQIESDKVVKKFIEGLGLSKAFIPSPREQARMQIEKTK